MFSLKFSKFLRTPFFVPPVAAFEHKAQEQFHFDLILLFLNSETKLPATYELFLWFLPSWEYVRKKYAYERENYNYLSISRSVSDGPRKMFNLSGKSCP